MTQACSQSWTSFKKQLRDGGTDSNEWPAPLVLPEPPTPSAHPGIIPRLSALVAQIKAHRNYTQAIGQDLWLIGSKHVIDPNAWKPILGIRLQAGHPIIIWTKGDAAGIEIWVERGDGNFAQLAINMEPYTTDTGALPPAGTSQVWRYRAIYLLHDAQVGQWSDIISLTVGG